MSARTEQALGRHRNAPPPERLKIEPPICPYCRYPSVYYPDSTPIYGANYGPLYACKPCDARIGTHPDGRPLGRMADAQLRKAKSFVHARFDPLWKDAAHLYSGDVRPSQVRGVARARAYQWLAAQMGIPTLECHVGMFSLEQCRAAYRILLDANMTDEKIRAWAKSRPRQ